ncbi:hypothetical protein [Spirosoma harenae]
MKNYRVCRLQPKGLDLKLGRAGQAHRLAPDSHVVYVVFAEFHPTGERVVCKSRLLAGTNFYNR